MADDDGSIGAIGDIGGGGGASDAGSVSESGPVATAAPPDADPAPARIDTNDSSSISSEATQADADGNPVASNIAGWAKKDPEQPGTASEPNADPVSKGDAQKADAEKKDDVGQLDPEKGSLRKGAGLGHGGPSDEVKTLQQRLARAGFDVGQPDGKFGPKTQHALEQFQRKNGLQIDGVAGPKTMDALNKLGPDGAKTDPAKPTEEGSRGAADPKATDPKAALNEHDQKLANFLSDYIQKHGAKGIPSDIGEKIVRAAQAHHVDPMALAAIPGLETHWGKDGVGINGLAGAGAYDKNPRNAVNNPAFRGVDNQIEKAARAFEHNRDRFGGSEDQSILRQLQAANGHGHGYSTSRKWAGDVYSVYRRMLRASQATGL
jgi:peptidoglycan hydrolase-like protein with peptidoglycan-binding domain